MVNGVKSDWAPVVSGVPQGTVLGPLLVSLHINDITSDIESEIRLFADDCVCYREIKNVEDTVKLSGETIHRGASKTEFSAVGSIHDSHPWWFGSACSHVQPGGCILLSFIKTLN